MRIFIFTWGIAVIISLSACPSSDISQSNYVKQSEICQTYNLTVNEEDSFLHSTIFFRFGGSTGTTLILNDSMGSCIKIGDVNLELIQNNRGAHYTNTEAFIPGIKTFTYIDNDGKTYLNNINCQRFKVYNMPKIINRKENLELHFEGSKPEASEMFICEYQDTSMTISSEFKITSVLDKTFILPIDLFQKMKNGPISLKFIRRNSVVTQAYGNIPGYLNYEYTGLKINCTLAGKGTDFVENEH